MILADHQIRQLAGAGMIDPFASRQVREDAIGQPCISYGLSSYGYDCRLGDEFKVMLPGGVLDPKKPEPHTWIDYSATGSVVLPPHSLALAHTVEYFKMPKDVTGQVVGKSTYARAGVHVLVTPAEAGWEGVLTLEIANLTPRPVRLYPGEGICQIVFHQGAPCERPYDASRKYQGQRGVTLGRV